MTTEKRETPVQVIGRIFSKPKRLLLVDDDERWIELFRQRCSRFNLEVVAANRCSAARLELQQGAFDAIVLDVRLTNGNGVELYRDVSARSPSTQVVFMTGFATEDVQGEIEKIGPARIYSKDRLADESFVDQLMVQFGAVRIGTGTPFSRY